MGDGDGAVDEAAAAEEEALTGEGYVVIFMDFEGE